MKKSLVIFLHLGYWMVYLFLLIIIFAGLRFRIDPHPSLLKLFATHPMGVMSTVPNVFAFYGFYFGIFPHILKQRRWWQISLVGITMAMTGAFLGCLILYIRFEDLKHLFLMGNEIINFMTWMSLVALIHGILALVIRGFIHWYEDIKVKEALTQKNFEMEMALIKSQINPHFLFNTIHNIDILIAKDPVKASAYLNKLSDIMRFMLYETKTERIPFEKEWDYLEKYIDLQKIRTANPHFVQYTLEGQPEGLFIAPMTLIPFVENAFKHAEGVKADHAIRIKVVIDGGTIDFLCQNKYLPVDLPKLEASGLGNELIRKRLSLLYAERHTLVMGGSDGGVFEVKLKVWSSK